MSIRAVLAILAVIAFIVLPNLVNFLMEWFWFGAIGYRDVFVTSLRTQASLGAFILLVGFLVLYGNLWIALSSIASPYIVIGARASGTVQPAMLKREQLRRLVGIGCLVISFMISMAVSGEWMRWLQFRHGVPFGVSDPILGYDISFYVFRLPLFDLAQQVAMALLIVAIIGCGAAYVLAGALNFTKRGGVSVAGKARAHLSLLGAGFFLLLAVSAYLQVPHLLTDVGTTSIVHGASYADVMARIPAARVLMIVAAIGAALAVYHAFSAAIWPLPLAFGLYLLTSVGGSLYAAGIQRFIVSPNEQAAEMPYMVHNIEATRQAFNLATVRVRQMSGDAELTRSDIERNADTIKNVRLWDHRPLLDTFGQIQELRTYYDFVSVDNDRYTVNGELRQVMLSARELNPESLPNRTWINEHLTFTHGYGITLGPVNEVTEEGLPILFVKDIPPQSTVSADIDVKEPSIYFGEVTNNYVLVNTKAKEFHYSKGEQNVETTYSGRDGVRIGGLGRKLLFSVGFQSLQILFSNDITPDTRVLYHRNITDRVATIAPFLRYDEDPYLVVSSEGRLFWIHDAYTGTQRYPYSTPAVAGLNYIRNSVKVVTDAYHGTTTFYLADPRDPLAQTLARAYPGLLKPLESMPADLRQHLRYPETIFAIQAAMYSTYHMTNPGVFYNKEDQWEIPAIDIDGNPQVMQPYYTVMRLPGEARAEFIQMLPFTPSRKDNLTAWMVARSDPERYGQLEVFEFPEAEDHLRAPADHRAHQSRPGDLPADHPLEPAGLASNPGHASRHSRGGVPALRAPALSQSVGRKNSGVEPGDRRLSRSDCDGWDARRRPQSDFRRRSRDRQASVYGCTIPSTSTTQPATPAPIDANRANRARQHYERAMQAQRDGNWALYGEEIRLLGEALREMAK